MAIDPLAMLDEARSGDKRAVGRLISLVENDPSAAAPLLRSVYADAEAGWVTGVTGAPGVGKSTLVDHIVRMWRDEGRQVAVLAVDPTSPFSGGALLGDRVRMKHDPADDGIFVRSMATRGWLGGLARATERAALLCAGLGYEDVVIETVGVGQSEVDVAAAADTTLVLLTPASGDAVQAAKAGVMEIGDIFVVNKADRPGAAEVARDLEEMLRLAGPGDGWSPPVLETSATEGSGLSQVAAALRAHREASEAGARLTARRVRDLHRALHDGVEELVTPLLESAAGKEAVSAVAQGAIDPWTAAAGLIRRVADD